MRFQKYLENNKHLEYKDEYLNYMKLRNQIKGEISQNEEDKFVVDFDSEFNKVFIFVKKEYGVFINKMAQVESNIKEKKGKKDLDDLQDEMIAFGEFVRINIEGFKRILTRHDKKSGYMQYNKYRKVIKKKIEDLENFDKLIYSSSRLKLKTVDVKKEKESGNTFIRKTNKYWVHTENLLALKMKIVKNLPIYVFSAENKGTPFSIWNYKTHDTCVSSVYLDNIKFDLYFGRIKKNQGAEAIRIRWYGSAPPSIVFVERKRHEDKWTGDF